jgi:heme oxygenase
MTMLAEELKERTARVHQESEKKMIRALKRIDTTEEYIRMLNWLYGFYAPIEALVHCQLTPELFPDMEKRCRAEYIRWDIEESGIPAPPPDICDELPRIDSFPRALGALYVLEGSTLGGRVIASLISRQLGSPKSLSFFSGYGAETGNMWQSLKDFLENPFAKEEKQEILAAAEETFLAFKHWIDRYELQPMSL